MGRGDGEGREERRAGVVKESGEWGGVVVAGGEGGTGDWAGGSFVHAGKAEFDCFVEFLRGGEVDAEFHSGLFVLVVGG